MEVAGDRETERLVERRVANAEHADDPAAREELWVESVRKHQRRRQEINRALWCEYFRRLAGCLRSRADEYDRRAENLEERRSA